MPLSEMMLAALMPFASQVWLGDKTGLAASFVQVVPSFEVARPIREGLEPSSPVYHSL